MSVRLFDLVNKLASTGVVIEQVIRHDVDVNISVDVVLNIVEELDNNVVSSGINAQGFDGGRLGRGRLNKHDRIVRVNNAAKIAAEN